MTTQDPRAEWAAMQQAIIEDVRRNGRPTGGPFKDRDLLVLTTTGVKTGQDRTSAVVYTRDGDDLVIVASKGGAPTNPSWYANLVANPVVTVETGGEAFRARATPIPSGEERDRLYAAHATAYPGFWEYQQKTERTIPVVRLTRLPEAA